MDIIIVTGLSGAGKSQAMRCLEDMGYYCVDNMPPALISSFVRLAENGASGLDRAAFVVDMRQGQFFDDLKQCLEQLSQEGRSYRIMFLEASDQALIKRYKETRRSHPLSSGGTIAGGIEKERAKLKTVRSKASFIIDTSNLKTVELRAEIRRLLLSEQEAESFTVTLESFGFKNGLPSEADWVLDTRFLPNPYYVKSLRDLTGNSKKIMDYCMRMPEAGLFADSVTGLLQSLIPSYIKEGKAAIVIALGCTGGRHRSVAMVNVLSARLKAENRNVVVIHRDL